MAVEMTATYEGDLRCRLAHGPSGNVVATDAPTDNAGKGESFSPTDLVGAALISCAVTTMAIKAPREGIPFGGASGRVVKVMSVEGPRRIARLTVELDMPAGLSPAQRERLEEMARTCPVALSLADSVELPMRFRYAEA
jgi:uncharacterized OsmC-like protein